MRGGRVILAVVAGLCAGRAAAAPPAARLLAPIPADDGLPPARSAIVRSEPPVHSTAPRPTTPSPDERESLRLGERMKDWWGKTTDHHSFQSDHAFDTLVSPVSSPFLFEDPRSSTEVRPLYVYQKVPSSQPDFNGGHIWFAGAQVRVALSERFSIVFNKLGAASNSAEGVTPFETGTGLAELWVGPKYTFIRNEQSGTVMAGGATFQIPAGSANAFQDTGSLSVVPYLSLAQSLAKTGLGSLNGLANGGYAFSVNKDRSNYFYLNAHLDLDVADTHRFYPLAELSYTQTTTNGRERAYLQGEGRDLFNAGGTGKGGLLTGALGGRVKVTKSLDVGATFELPLAGQKDFFSSRFTVDLIWRY